MNKRGDTVYIVITGLLILAIGLLVGYKIGTPESGTVGFYKYNSPSRIVEKTANGIEEERGDWVCFDISDINNMEYAKGIISHELAHHIYRHTTPANQYVFDKDEHFAEFCETNLTRCGYIWENER